MIRKWMVFDAGAGLIASGAQPFDFENEAIAYAAQMVRDGNIESVVLPFDAPDVGERIVDIRVRLTEVSRDGFAPTEITLAPLEGIPDPRAMEPIATLTVRIRK